MTAQDEAKERLLRQLEQPVISVREQLKCKADRINALVDLGTSPLEILEAIGGSEAKPSRHGDQTKWGARAVGFAPELTVYGGTAEEARANLVQRLRYYDPAD